MKLLISLVCLSIALSAFSQLPDEKKYFQFKKTYPIPNFDTTSFKIEMIERLMQLNQNTIIKPGNVGFDSKLGKMHFLPQDGMACIVPDMNAFQTMPNIGLQPEIKFHLLIETMPNLFKEIIITKGLFIK